MSTELAWIWVQLLWAVDERELSLLLSLKLWKCISNDSDRNFLLDQGIDFLVLKGLPHLKLPDDDNFWEGWFTKQDFPNVRGISNQLSPYPVAGAVSALISQLPVLGRDLDLQPDHLEDLTRGLQGLRTERMHPTNVTRPCQTTNGLTSTTTPHLLCVSTGLLPRVKS